MNSHTKVLVLGLGSIGQRHARLLSERSDVDVLLCDISEELRRQASGALVKPPSAVYASYAAALESHPDIVFICVPNHLHVPMALEAIRNGTDVLVEKPVSDSLEKARELVKAAEASSRFLQVGYMLRYDEGLITLKEIIDKGEIGNLVGGRAMIGTYVTLLNAKGSDRIDHPNSLVVDYTHELDFISWFFGKVEDVMAMQARMGDLELKPHPNIFQINLKFSSGALVQVHMDYIQFPQRRVFEVYGDRGTLCYDFMTGEIRHFTFQRAHEWTNKNVLPVTERWDDLFRKEHESVFTRRSDGLPPFVSGADGLQALEIAVQAIRVAR
ncbi:Gfo/Idh/MocA family oxidoreductase [Agriterribacter sp.]|uniref:Gfo/Idh/MocA family protein n=1 Tax=Agriterribacter sp. TaxID=2821509 RepID=UPI002D1F9A45|nr:Gfo/Idh/MocA family oxidoreductase [Agriterribacter sp.]